MPVASDCRVSQCLFYLQRFFSLSVFLSTTSHPLSLPSPCHVSCLLFSHVIRPVHHIRASNSYIRGTNGSSNGIVPMLRVFNNTARYVDQGGGKRKGSIAIYLEPWHADIIDFLDLKKNHGNEMERARDLFYAMWVPDLFMKRVKANGTYRL